MLQYVHMCDNVYTKENKNMTQQRKKRVPIALTEEQHDKLVRLCNEIGISKTSFLTMIVNQHMNAYEQVMKAMTTQKNYENIIQMIGEPKDD